MTRLRIDMDLRACIKGRYCEPRNTKSRLVGSQCILHAAAASDAPQSFVQSYSGSCRGVGGSDNPQVGRQRRRDTSFCYIGGDAKAQQPGGRPMGSHGFGLKFAGHNNDRHGEGLV